MFESRIAGQARWTPASMAAPRVRPPRNSSLTRSKISTLASTAMPTDRMKPVRPARVRVTPKNLKMASVIARKRAEQVAAFRVERDADVGRVRVRIRGAARIGNHAPVDLREHRFVAGILLGIGRIQLLERRGVGRSGLPLPDGEVGGLAQ